MVLVNESHITDELLSELLEFIHRNYNYDFRRYAKPSLKRRIARICNVFHLNNPEKLLDRFKETEEFTKEFVSELTVGVTEMFRDPECWLFLKNNILPSLNKREHTIWHAGCSTGEEVYTAAILFKEVRPNLPIRQIASDINPDYLEHAESGHFNHRKTDLYHRNYQKFNPEGNFFLNLHEEENGYSIDKRLRTRISFLEHDLVLGNPLGKFDFIFCRNVLIYFENELQNDILLKFYNQLKPNGFLILGQFESLIWCPNFEKFHQPNELINVLIKKD